MRELEERLNLILPNSLHNPFSYQMIKLLNVNQNLSLAYLKDLLSEVATMKIINGQAIFKLDMNKVAEFLKKDRSIFANKIIGDRNEFRINFKIYLGEILLIEVEIEAESENIEFLSVWNRLGRESINPILSNSKLFSFDYRETIENLYRLGLNVTYQYKNAGIHKGKLKNKYQT